MNGKSLDTSFIEYFCNADLSGIDSLLSRQFALRGPLFEFNSKQDYINSLNENLEADPTAKILTIIANDNEAAAFYTYRGNRIGQLFRFRE